MWMKKTVRIAAGALLALAASLVCSQGSYPTFGSDVWWSALAPTGTPPEIINRLNAEFGRASQLADLQERYAALGIVGAQ